MSHLTEEQLVLHYYGEEEEDELAAARHLEECGACRELYGSLARVLNVMDSDPLPERAENYGAAVWARLEPRLSARRPLLARLLGWQYHRPLRALVAAAGVACLLVAAFLAGRFSRQPESRQPVRLAAADPQAGERVLLVAVGDYLERSQMVLVELANARPEGALDISAERERAADLVSESRLYRQTAIHAGETELASVLDDLDRVLLEISHAPDRVSPEQLENLRRRFEAEGILFKIRVLGSNVRSREEVGPRSVHPGGRKL